MTRNSNKNQWEHRITGWYVNNPREVEVAFREGFFLAARQGINLPIYKIEALYRQMMKKRGSLYWFGKWDHTKAALLRGKSHGFWYLYDHLTHGGSRESCHAWLEEVEPWANEQPPRMESRHAMPPELRFKEAKLDQGEPDAQQNS